MIISPTRLKLISENPSSWLADAEYYETNKDWLDKSALIAVKVLSALRSQSLSQKELADIIGVSPQYVNKVLKGRKSLTRHNCKIEKSLGISLIAVPTFQSSQVIAGSFEWYPQIISRNNSLLLGSEKKDYNPESNYSNHEEYQAA
ncbi:MAG: helix-turn-helix transcriptional regulator [Bacteroidales bacterium]|nr:helix-turn-helix transcriptional regulator [Bacteroidales bacterium]